MKKQSGFTLIELVVVVVLLGLLAVTAIPKFLDLTEQAKQANIEGVAGGFATGVSLARAQWEAESRPHDSKNNNIVSYDGLQVVLTRESTTGNIRPGYILGSVTDVGVTNAVTINNVNCLSVWNSLLQNPPSATDSADKINNSGMNYFVSKSATDEATTCHYYLISTLTRDSNSKYVSPGTATTVGNNFTYQPATSVVAININANSL